jgi:hypothetical protein
MYFSILFSIGGKLYEMDATIVEVLLSIVPLFNTLHLLGVLVIIGSPIDNNRDHRYLRRNIKSDNFANSFFGLN